MQFEVFAHRLEHEFGAGVELASTSYRVARRTDESTAERLRRTSGARVLTRTDGALLALFESPLWLARLESEHPGWVLDRLIAE
jgi:peptide chain release factor 3